MLMSCVNKIVSFGKKGYLNSKVTKKFKQAALTRWNSNLRMLESIELVFDELENLLHNTDKCDSSGFSKFTL